MIPVRLLLSLASSVLSEHIPQASDAFAHHPRSPSAPSFSDGGAPKYHVFAKRDVEKGSAEYIVFAILIPVLVILSGIFAGLTLGYMSLDETQLHVLSISGTPKQKEYAKKIMPIRQNGHLLLVTLLVANMIVNETLPIISDPVLGGGLLAVVVSTVLIILFSEIIPQSICTRHGLYIGAKMAGPTRILIYALGIVSWPVAKLLEFILGPHHGIIYRRAELKELIAMHAKQNPLGGDLRPDTVNIIGATLDLQDKTVRNAMTPIDRAFMLHIDAKLDYETLRRICATGHSRIPVYELVEIKVPRSVAIAAFDAGIGDEVPPREILHGKKSIDSNDLVKTKVKKIIGILLVKQCVLLDPEDAVPVRKMRLNKVPFVPQNEPILGILDKFQEGRSHIAIVSRLSVEKAQSVKVAVKKGLTRRLLGAVRRDSDSSSDDTEEDDEGTATGSMDKQKDKASHDGIEPVNSRSDTYNEKEGDGQILQRGREKRRKSTRHDNTMDLERGDLDVEARRERERTKVRKSTALEQSMPADAVLSKANAEEYLASQAIDPSIMPLGIITLEDVLEELIGEEIYDEFDVEGTGAHSQSFVPPGAQPNQTNIRRNSLRKKNGSAPELAAETVNEHFPKHGRSAPVPHVGISRSLGVSIPKPIALPSLKTLGFLRSRSAPPTPRRADSAPPTVPGTPTSQTPHAPVSGTVTPMIRRESPVSGIGPMTRPPSSLSTRTFEGDARPLSLIIENPGTDENVSVQHVHGSIAPDRDMVSSPVEESSTILAVPKPSRAGVNTLLHPATVAGPRSGSPSASLEAILLDRKRRAMTMATATSTSSATPTGTTIGAPGKGKGGFKSSPLTAVDPNANVVIADEIRRQSQLERERLREATTSGAGDIQRDEAVDERHDSYDGGSVGSAGQKKFRSSSFS